MLSYFEYLTPDHRVPLNEASLPGEVRERADERFVFAEWPAEQREHLFLRRVSNRLEAGYRVVVGFNDDASEADFWWFVPPERRD